MKQDALRVLMRLYDEPWLMTENKLGELIEIAGRVHEIDPELLESKQGRYLSDAFEVQVRDGVAIIPVVGPIFRYANLFTMISGATSVQILATDFRTALENNAVESILLNIDSPGGEAAGIHELADMIYAARARKPVMAYVDSLGASGAYWIASAAERIYADQTAYVGSIGVVATVRDNREKDARNGIHQFVSSVSPLKRANPATEEGRGHLQKLVDQMADIFVANVARNRNKTVEAVESDFGRGGLLIAGDALQAGMIDQATSFEALVGELAVKPVRSLMRASSEKETHMDESEANALRREGALAERARITAILGCEEAKDKQELAQALALESELTPDQAKTLLIKAPAPQSNGFARAMEQVQNPKVQGGDAPEETVETEAQRIANFLPSSRRYRGGK